MMKDVSLPDSPDVVIESAETVWQGRFPLQLIRFRQRRFDGSLAAPRTWELLRRGRAAAILPYDPVADMVVVIEQFRLPAFAARLPPVMLELAAGLVDGTDTPEATIRRESMEEMGLEVAELERIGDFLLTPGGCDELCTLFAGRVRLGPVPADGILGMAGLASEGEDIRVRALPAAQVIEQAIAGAYPNSVATIGLLWFAARRDWLRARWQDRQPAAPAEGVAEGTGTWG
jgi:ADP-ribose pyrophosphatase